MLVVGPRRRCAFLIVLVRSNEHEATNREREGQTATEGWCFGRSAAVCGKDSEAFAILRSGPRRRWHIRFLAKHDAYPAAACVVKVAGLLGRGGGRGHVVSSCSSSLGAFPSVSCAATHTSLRRHAARGCCWEHARRCWRTRLPPALGEDGGCSINHASTPFGSVQEHEKCAVFSLGAKKIRKFFFHL